MTWSDDRHDQTLLKTCDDRTSTGRDHTHIWINGSGGGSGGGCGGSRARETDAAAAETT